MEIKKTIYCEDCKKEVIRDFRFTDWYYEENDVFGTWEDCLEEFNKAIKEDETGRFSIYAVTICDNCDSELEHEGVIFNEKCEVYKYGN